MAFNRPQLQTIIDRIESDISARVAGGVALLRRSVLRVLARVYAGAIHLLYGYLDYRAKQLFATTADAEGLEIIGNEFGITREAAVKATGSGQATGTNGTVITAGSELSSSDGNKYTIDSDATIALGVATVAFTASTANSDSNDLAGITLTFTNPIAGVNTSVTVDSNGITGGLDTESDDDYRERILQRKRQLPHGGADFDYENWAKEVAGVTRAWSFPLYNGIGTIGLTFVRDNDTSIIPSDSEITEVQNYIISHSDPATAKTVGIPVTAEPGLFVYAPSKLELDFTIALNPNNSTVQAQVTAELTDLINREGGPGETIYLSEMDEAISLAEGELRHVMSVPASDSTATNQQVHVLGTITFTTLS